jgi:hypothetical protein
MVEFFKYQLEAAQLELQELATEVRAQTQADLSNDSNH